MLKEQRCAQFGWMMLFGAVACLQGCAMRAGGSGGLSRSFDLPGVTNEVAYQRATDFMHTCHHGITGLTTTIVTGEIYPERKASEVRAQFSGGMEPEHIRIQQEGTTSRVAVETIHRVGKWDEKELDAAQRSIESGTPSCR